MNEDKFRAIVREELRAPLEEISISKATRMEMNKLLTDAGICATTDSYVTGIPDDFLPLLQPFDWSRGENPSTADACARLAQYLSAAGVPMAPVSPGFKIADVHTRAMLTTQLGRVKLKGGADAFIIPSTQSADFAFQQARIVVDFKVNASDFLALLGQAEAELLAASSLSHHDVMVVFTDLNERGHILRAEGDQLIVWKNLDIRETIYVMTTFLSSDCAVDSVADLDDVRVPGAPLAKKRRKSFVDAVHGMLPSSEALMDQLAAFHGGGWDGYLEGRDLVLSSLGFDRYDEGKFPSYFS
jgi:hypothetical protein